MFDFAKYFTDSGIQYFTSGKNVTPGNVNIQCPFCADHSNHLNCDPQWGSVRCWRCGPHQLSDLIREISGKEVHFVSILKKYSEFSNKRERPYLKKKPVAGICKLPRTDETLNYRAGKYLSSRGYDPAYMVDKYSIKSTGPVGKYKFRVVIPVEYNGETVSFVARDYTGKHPLRYITAGREEEQRHHKDILYNLDNAVYDSIIVVEGITDVWNIGDGAVATFGTTVTDKQVLLLSSLNKTIYILFDNEPEAQKHVEELSDNLRLLGAHTEILYLPDGVADPGELNTKQVQKIRNFIFGE